MSPATEPKTTRREDRLDIKLSGKHNVPEEVKTARAEVRLLASAKNWIEGSAVQQLNKTAELPGMKLAVGLPDLHPGKGSPIGAAFAVQGRIYPTLVGNDIGCGIGLWQTSLDLAKVKREKLAERLRGLDGPWEGDLTAWMRDRNLQPSGHDNALGTIGGGNHFAELQAIERVEDPQRFSALGLTADKLYLLVHSGSRGLGEAILRQYTDRFGGNGLPEDSEEFRAYLESHDHAVCWARANRELIAKRVLDRLGSRTMNPSGTGLQSRPILDVCHNWVDRKMILGESCWLHRKGAAPTTEGPVVIPGSRGAWSYLVTPAADCDLSACSVAHGAGRKWARSDARGRLEKRYTAEELVRTELGSRVICEDDALLFEEAPQCYKNISVVVEDLVQHGLVEIVAVLRPLVTYKVRRRSRGRE